VAIQIDRHLYRGVAELFFDVQHGLAGQQEKAGVAVAQIVDPGRMLNESRP
jgi:hypothetical protein